MLHSMSDNGAANTLYPSTIKVHQVPRHVKECVKLFDRRGRKKLCYRYNLGVLWFHALPVHYHAHKLQTRKTPQQ